MYVDLDLLERWQRGWSLARGLPMPVRESGGLKVEVGYPDQLRRYVFADAGGDLQSCGLAISEPCVHIKAPVDMATLRASLPQHWQMEELRYLMRCDGPMRGKPDLPPGYAASEETEFGARLVRVLAQDGTTAAIGRVAVCAGSAVFDRIETSDAHRRRGLASCVMLALDRLAAQDGARERLLVATEAGRPLYTHLGWELLSPYSTAITGGN